MTPPPPSASSDAELAAQLAAGELDRLTLVKAYERFFPGMIIAAARALREHSAAAEDVAQETFSRILLEGTLARLKDRTRVRAFLKVAAERAALDALRVLARRKELDRQVAVQMDTMAEAMLSPDPAPELAARLDERLRKLLGRLGEVDRQILSLRLLERRSLSEIASRLKLSYSATAQRYSRAKARLLQVLET